MERKEFLSQIGIGAAAIFIPACIGGLSSCKKTETTTKVDFTVETSTGSLATNGGSLISNGVIVARTLTGTFLAVAAACTHQGTNVNYNSSNNNFVCPNHGAKYDSSGNVTLGPATTNLTKYNTTLTGTSLRVYS
jgi:cytochrome b6-f complex iron-sulfur subunit